MSGTGRRTNRSIQLAGIPTAFVSKITVAEWSEDVTEVAMGVMFNTRSRRDELIERYGADEHGHHTFGRLAGDIDSHRRR